MSNYDQLYKILDKEKISIKELRELTNNELVTAISPSKSDKILYHKYDVRLGIVLRILEKIHFRNTYSR